MKVFQINSVYGVGSTGRIMKDLHDVLLKNGYDSYVAYGRNNTYQDDRVFRVGSTYEQYLSVFYTRFFDMHGIGCKKATHDLINILDEVKPDVIHIHNIHGYYVNIEKLIDYISVNRIPVVWTLHDCWNYTGHCTYYDFENCNKWTKECHDCPQVKEYPKSYFIDNSKRNFNKKKNWFENIERCVFVTPSKWLAKEVKRSFLMDHSVQVINNGIDLEVFKETKGDFKSKNNIAGKFVILGVANIWDRRKGLKYFIELSKMVSDDFVICIVGLNENQLENLPSNIIGISRTNNVEELVEIYSSADVFINPTLEDNYPTTNLESLACGTPVITFDTGGSGEILDETCGIIVPKEDMMGIVNSIYRIKESKESYTSILCRNRAEKMVDKWKNYMEYIDLYKKIGVLNENSTN